MFRANKVIPVYETLIGWQQHFDTSEITLPADLLQSDSGEFYQQKHAALRLDIISTLLPERETLENYLKTTVKNSTVEIFNDLLQYRKLKEHGKTLLERAILLNRYGWAGSKVVNQGRFVGFQIKIRENTGLKAVIEQIGLQLSGPDDVTLYLFHSAKLEPLDTIEMGLNNGKTWNWKNTEIDLNAFEVGQVGGYFILGYYQDDLSAQAVNQKDYDFNNGGYCNTCDPYYSGVFKSINNIYQLVPFYVPAGEFVYGECIDLEKAIYTSTETWGLNLMLSGQCDFTEFFAKNKMAFKNLLALKVTYNVLQMMKFSLERNHVEERIKDMIIRDIEGDKETNLTNIPNQYQRELRGVSYDVSGLNDMCLKTEQSGYSPTYGVI